MIRVDPRTLVISEELHAHVGVMLQDESDALSQSITEEGVLSPVIVWRRGEELWVVDGRHRVLQAIENGHDRIECIPRQFGSVEEAAVWAIRHQLARRNWNTSQRRLAMQRLLEIRSRVMPITPAIAQVADEIGVSVSTARRAADSIRKEKSEKEQSESTGKSPKKSGTKSSAKNSEDGKDDNSEKNPRKSPAKKEKKTEASDAKDVDVNAKARMRRSSEAMDRWKRSLREMKSTIKSSDDPWIGLRMEAICATLDQICNTLDLCKGEGLCPRCGAAGCEVCKGCGYLPRQQMEAAKEMQS